MRDVILAIESSCDDMSVAVIADGRVLSNVTATQLIHRDYGGVVPEVASRQHHVDIVPTMQAALSVAKVQIHELKAIAFTQGPGLLGSLIVGVSFAKGLSLALDIPLIAVHHMHAHILSHFAIDPKPEFPFLCLTVSGGHTQIVKVNAYDDLQVLGSTIDDAAGEAFDKVGKMIGLPYPSGPVIDKLAQEGEARYTFAKPRIAGYDFSFSGFKTSVLYFLKSELAKDPDFITKNTNDICASVQKAIVDILMEKLATSMEAYKITRVGLAGGVAANSSLRAALMALATKNNIRAFIPEMQYCTDNAGMVGIAAWFKYLDGRFVNQNISPDPRLSF